ncbi:MAG: peptidoglycan-associated lipoprotein Pal [Pseudomonadota bacterium]
MSKGLMSVAALAIVLAGCSSRGALDEDIPSAAEANAVSAAEAQAAAEAEAANLAGSESGNLDGELVASGTGGSTGFPDGFMPREAIFDPDSTLAQRIFYFDFNQDTIDSQYIDAISDHGRYLATYPDATVRLEGHADERGTREYNIALGERRAQAIKRLIMLQGASYNQVITLSFGEEQPAVLGQTEAAWAQNRRVELIYE